MERKSSQPFELFYCYARKDRELRDELDIHLAGLRRSGLITAWYNGEIIPGKPWKLEIEKHLDTAHIILLLISPDFIHSDCCYSEEMEHAIKRHHQGKARVVPILLRPHDWSDTPFSTLQMLPSDAEPVTLWPNRDAAFTDIAKGIRRVVNDLHFLPLAALIPRCHYQMSNNKENRRYPMKNWDRPLSLQRLFLKSHHIHLLCNRWSKR